MIAFTFWRLCWRLALKLRLRAQRGSLWHRRWYNLQRYLQGRQTFAQPGFPNANQRWAATRPGVDPVFKEAVLRATGKQAA